MFFRNCQVAMLKANALWQMHCDKYTVTYALLEMHCYQMQYDKIHCEKCNVTYAMRQMQCDKCKEKNAMWQMKT